MSRFLAIIVALLLFAPDVDAQGRRGGVGTSGAMRAGGVGASGAMRVGGVRAGSMGSSMRTGTPSRMPTSSMGIPSSNIRMSSSLSARHPVSSARLPYTRGHVHHGTGHLHSSHLHYRTGAHLYRPSYHSLSYGVHLRSYPSSLYRFPYTRSYYYPFSYGYRSSLIYGSPYISRSIVAVPSYGVYDDAQAYDYVSPTISPDAIVPRVRSTGSGPERLARSLASREGGDRWLEHLAPHRVIELMKQNDGQAISELLRRYDGVLNNPELRAIANMDGFEATRALLYQFANARPAQQEPIPDPPPISEAADEPEALPNPLTETSLKDAA